MVAESFVLSRLLCKRILHNSSTKALNKLAKYHKIAQKIKYHKNQTTLNGFQWKLSLKICYYYNYLVLKWKSVEIKL